MLADARAPLHSLLSRLCWQMLAQKFATQNSLQLYMSHSGYLADARAPALARSPCSRKPHVTFFF